MTTWFTSDTHFGHTNILRYEPRPYTHIQDHDRDLVKRWNSKVSRSDAVYHLGDFGLAQPAYLVSILAKLNGQIFLVKGNHDKFIRNKVAKDKFAWVKDYYELKINKKKVILFHYPILSWNSKHYDVVHLHGHAHGHAPPDPAGRRIEVGVDAHDYYPISYEEVEALVGDRPAANV